MQEATRNHDFAERLMTPPDDTGRTTARTTSETGVSSTKIASADKPTPRKKRATAALDPIRLAAERETALCNGLESPTLQQLKKIVSEYLHDASGSGSNWQLLPKMREFLVDRALPRARNGDVLR